MHKRLQNIPTDIIQVLTPRQAWHYQILPYQMNEAVIRFFAIEQKKNEGIEEELEMLFLRKIELTPWDENEIRTALVKYYRKQETNGNSILRNALKIDSDDFLEKMIEEAKCLGSSDIHIEPYEEKCRIRLRIDGVLVERFQLPKDQFPALVNKIKIKSNLDIAEKRLPQDGRIFFQGEKQRFDIRVSSLPTLHGEKIVMRLLGGSEKSIDFQLLGFKGENLQSYLQCVQKPNGMVLISGPTGSGKTTTLYATLQLLNQSKRNILTIEDPIEYTMEGINQVQLKEAIGLNFANTMRTFLRQDPDVIMVGEIRDVATADMAIRASLTGHLVLSTIHTNSAWGIVPRLIDMGVPSYLLADTLNGAVAQRLVRILCPYCKSEENFHDHLLPRNFQPIFFPDKHFVPGACEYCHFSGYKGRKAVFEVILIDAELSEAIRNLLPNIHDILDKLEFSSLAENAFTIFKKGETSIQEIYPILANSR